MNGGKMSAIDLMRAMGVEVVHIDSMEDEAEGEAL